MFTKGPWEMYECGHDAENGARVLTAVNKNDVAHVYSQYDHNEVKSTARLIAAAPEMYQFLVNVSQRLIVSDHTGKFADLNKQAERLLAKITGNQNDN